MAVFQVATNDPSKPEIIAEWMSDQPWHAAAVEAIDVVGSFHLEDPEGEVGMHVHIVASAGQLFQIPLTYRGRRATDVEGAYICSMEHSALGTRYVYDGFGDHRFLSTMAGVAACGYGQTLGFAEVDGRWQAWPESAKVHGFGAVAGRVLVDRFERVDTGSTDVVVRNEQIELTAFRILGDRPSPAIGMAATWPGQAVPVSLASIIELDR